MYIRVSLTLVFVITTSMLTFAAPKVDFKFEAEVSKSQACPENRGTSATPAIHGCSSKVPFLTESVCG